MIYTEDFLLFWQVYPPRYNENTGLWRRADKIGACIEWGKLTIDEKVAALNKAQREKPSKYTPDARKFLKHKPWEDDIGPLRKFTRPPPKEIQAMVDKILVGKIVPSARVSNYQRNRRRNEALDKLGL